ncbi:hypothetical protein INR49_032336, partial [Caranx melampygus]
MEALKFVAVLLVVVFVQVFGTLGLSPLSSEEEDGEVWTVENWQGYPLERGISIRLADLIKRSKAQQFHGLMGRSSGVFLMPVQPSTQSRYLTGQTELLLHRPGQDRRDRERERGKGSEKTTRGQEERADEQVVRGTCLRFPEQLEVVVAGDVLQQRLPARPVALT